MRKPFFYASHILAAAVFYMFYMFMLWSSIDMASRIADFGATFWTGLTEAGLIALTFAALALFLIAAYHLLVKGPQESAREGVSAQIREQRQSANQQTVPGV